MNLDNEDILDDQKDIIGNEISDEIGENDEKQGTEGYQEHEEHESSKKFETHETNENHLIGDEIEENLILENLNSKENTPINEHTNSNNSKSHNHTNNSVNEINDSPNIIINDLAAKDKLNEKNIPDDDAQQIWSDVSEAVLVELGIDIEDNGFNIEQFKLQG